LYAQALTIQQKLGDQRGESTSLWNMAQEQFKLGERAKALANANTALKILDKLDEGRAAQVRARLKEWQKKK
jgi:hypothetical protein